MWLSFTRPYPALVLQATNAGERRPGYEVVQTKYTRYCKRLTCPLPPYMCTISVFSTRSDDHGQKLPGCVPLRQVVSQGMLLPCMGFCPQQSEVVGPNHLSASLTNSHTTAGDSTPEAIPYLTFTTLHFNRGQNPACTQSLESLHLSLSFHCRQFQCIKSTAPFSQLQ